MGKLYIPELDRENVWIEFDVELYSVVAHNLLGRIATVKFADGRKFQVVPKGFIYTDEPTFRFSKGTSDTFLRHYFEHVGWDKAASVFYIGLTVLAGPDSVNIDKIQIVREISFKGDYTTVILYDGEKKYNLQQITFVPNAYITERTQQRHFS